MTTTFSTSSSATAPGDPNNGAWTRSNGSLTTSRTPGGVTGANTAGAGLSSGKWYWEMTCGAAGSGALCGIIKSADDITTNLGHSANGWGYNGANGNLVNNNASVAYGSTYTTNDVVGIAYDAGNGNLWFSKNGAWQASATIAEINAGTTTHAAKTGLSGTFFPAASDSASSGTAVTWTLAPATPLQFTVPTGYRPLDAAVLSMTASPLSYAFTLSSITGKRALHLIALPISYAFTLTANVMHWGRYMAALPLSFAFTLKATILAAVVQSASKLKRRLVDPILTKLRVTDPTLGD